jgi:hypothetical protein
VDTDTAWAAGHRRRCELASDWWLTLYGAMTLALLRNHGQDEVAALEGELFTRYQATHFLPALDKLGLGDEPTDAIRCGKYHYLANTIGGLDMEYVEETPRKVWVRYRPPSYVFDHPARPSTGIAALGSAFGEAPMRAWHANNGRLLGNRRLGFAMTQVQADGDPYDAGYFFEGDHDLAPGETFRRVRGEWGPPFDPTRAPVLREADWPPDRRAAAQRNYALNYVALKLRLLVERLGSDQAAAVVAHAWAAVFAQRHRWLPEMLDVPDPATPSGAAVLVARLGATTGDEVGLEHIPGGGVRLHLGATGLHRLFPGMPAALEDAMAAGWATALRLFHPDLRLRAGPRVWEIAR